MTANRPHSHRNRGFVLVSVLWILAILTVVALGFGRRAMLERRMAWYALDQAQAQQMARGAVELAIVEIFNKASLDRYYQQGAYAGHDQRWARPLDLLASGGYYQTVVNGDLEGDVCIYRIYDAAGRVSINTSDEAILRELEGMDFRVMRDISARRKPEANAELNLIPFSIPEELHTEGGIEDEDWYGDEDRPGLRTLLTTVGSGRININTAHEAVLRAVPDLDDDLIDALVGYRNGPDGVWMTEDDRAIRSLSVISEVLGISAEKVGTISQYCMVGSASFIIEAYATRRGGRIVALCSVGVEIRAMGAPRIVYWREGPVDASF